ncbi:MAG: metalloregulator ArsR/SmtB family transcription factor [Bacillota bacterium]
MEVVKVIKALADETRIRMLNLLYKEPLCVCDLEEILEIAQSNASRHLTKLKSAKLIVGNKQAQWIYYRVDKKILARYPFTEELLCRGLDKSPQCQKDLVRLKRYQNRGGNCEADLKLDDQ